MSWTAPIEQLFRFVPPTSPEVKARHARVREAAESAERIVGEQWADLLGYQEHPVCVCEQGPTLPLVDGRFCAHCGRMTTPAAGVDPLLAERTPQLRFETIGETLVSFALVVDDCTPINCGWTCACDIARTKREAIRAIQLARNAANEVLLIALRRQGGEFDIGDVLLTSGIFAAQMRLARYHASTVIATTPPILHPGVQP